MGAKFGSRAGDCPVAETISDRIIRLPFYNSITKSEINRVIDGIMSFEIG
jgi:dTDP-4-amino-4,6-dideoxygalactose transaminase